MKVYLANEVGFCFGVKRAINMTKQALAEHNEVSILGDVVHNRTVTSELEARGLVKVTDSPGGARVQLNLTAEKIIQVYQNKG